MGGRAIALIAAVVIAGGCGKTRRIPGYNGQINSIAVIGAEIWAGTPSGLLHIPPSGKPELFAWTGTSSGTLCVSPASLSGKNRELVEAHGALNQVRGVCGWGKGLALATAGGVMEFSIESGRFGKIWTSRNGLGNESVRSVYARGNRLWAATIFGASLLDSRGDRWKNYDMAAGLPSRHAFVMTEYSDKLWVACINGGLAWFDEPAGKWKAVPQERGLGNKYIYSMDTAVEGLWLGTAGGVNLYGERGGWDEKTCSDGLTEYCVYAVRKAGDSIWFGTAYGLFYRSLKPGDKAVTVKMPGLPSDDITCIVADKGRLLVGTKAGVVRIKL